MMKVGILTWFRNYNYGGCLQALALQRSVEKCGCDVELINYSRRQSLPWWSFQKSCYVPRDLFGVKKLTREILSRICPLAWGLEKEVRVRNCVCFVNKFFKSISSEAHDAKGLADISQGYDCVVVGSDQIWNPDWIDGGEYLLSCCKETPRRISYAASLGRTSIPEGLNELYRWSLLKFSAISVREQSAREALTGVLNDSLPARWVVDPTLLLTADEWRALLNLSVGPENNVIVCYWLSSQEGLVAKLHALASKMNCRIHLYMDAHNEVPQRFLRVFDKVVKIKKTADAREFVRDVSGARAIVADSFHALMFSVIFRRNVRIVISRGRENMASRIYDFAKRIDMRNCLAEDVGSSIFDSGETMWSESELSTWIEESNAWLNENLKRMKNGNCSANA